MTAKTPRRKPRGPSAVQLGACDAWVGGEPVLDIAERLHIARSTLYSWQRAGWWRDAVARLRATHSARAEAELARYRPTAVRALGRVLEAAERDPDAVPTATVLDAAKEVLRASAPPSQAQEQRALARLLPRLSPETRARVVAELDGDEQAQLAAMSMSEVDAVLGVARG